jgi:hypothetical protein
LVLRNAVSHRTLKKAPNQVIENRALFWIFAFAPLRSQGRLQRQGKRASD